MSNAGQWNPKPKLTHSKRPSDKNQSSKFFQSDVEQTHFQNLKEKRKWFFFNHRGTLSKRAISFDTELKTLCPPLDIWRLSFLSHCISVPSSYSRIREPLHFCVFLLTCTSSTFASLEDSLLHNILTVKKSKLKNLHFLKSCLPQTFCIIIVFDFSWDIFREIEYNAYANFSCSRTIHRFLHERWFVAFDRLGPVFD